MRNKKRQPVHFGVCIDNKGYPASLEAGKLYPVVPDEEAAKHGYVRVVDESGEDYWYSAERFFMLEVPDALAKALRARSRPTARQPSQTLRPVAASSRRRV